MRSINPYRCLLKGTLVGCSAVIMLSFAWYSFLGEGKGGTGDYFTSYKLDKLCKETQNPSSWYCYRAEIHRDNALALADWGMKCGLIGTLATIGLAVTRKKNEQE